MKNNILIIFLYLILSSALRAENILIEAKSITIDKINEITIFEKDVIIKTLDGRRIESNYAEYNKKIGFIKLKKNIKAIDAQNNILETEYADYNDKSKIFNSIGPTKITTTEKYIIEGEDVLLDDFNNYIKSDKKTTITDQENNKIFLENFEYKTEKNIFKSIGNIKVIDKLKNKYEFSEIYIDTKKKEILGSDTKAFLNDNNFKSHVNNKPRIFSNAIRVTEEKSTFKKSIFTLCDYRKNDKCPPWSIQASQMLHDNKQKTIYYENAVIKVYDIPIFYFPKLSHPDVTVDRRSGFLISSIHDSKNLGEGLTVPYFWAINKEKDFTLTNKLYASENPLFMGEYRQAFENSNLALDFGYTKGYKKTSLAKASGEKNHFFSKFEKNFNYDDSENNLKIITQDVSNDKYLKLYKINRELANKDIDTLENSLNFAHSSDDLYVGLSASMFETLGNEYVDKYEYVLPEITLDKNLFSDFSYGSLDLQSNIKVHNYDTNKSTKFLVNNFDWGYRDINFGTGIQTKILSKVKNINYETKNVKEFKEDTTNELHGALGFLNKIDMYKKINNFSEHFLKPKLLLRYAPGEMRKTSNGSRLNPTDAFTLDRLNDNNNFEKGLSTTLGFDYEIRQQDRKFELSVAQIINEKENKNMPSITSLDEKTSDFVGSTNLKINDNLKFKYNFALDENYNDLNYNELSASIINNKLNFDFSYLQEKKHIGLNEYVKPSVSYYDKNTLVSFENKRNLITNSSEFYNLSYEYINDCLRAGLVYRREFYNDSEIEAEDSLMFKITLVPFGNVNAPSF